MTRTTTTLISKPHPKSKVLNKRSMIWRPTGDFEGGFQPFKQSVCMEAIKVADAAHSRQGGLAGVGTDLIDLDKLLGGFHRSDLIDPGRTPRDG